MENIPCFVVGFHNYEHIFKCLQSLQNENLLNVFYFDNFSNNSLENREKLKSLVDEGSIKECLLLDTNLSSNTFDRLLPLYLENIKKSKYTIITDGDLIPDKGFVEEQISTLEKYDDIVACSTPLYDINLPLESFPNCGNWIPSRTCVEDYCYPQGGMHMVMVKSEFLILTVEIFNRNRIPFLDSNFNLFIEKQGKKWVVCKNSHSYHLTWDLYKDTNNEYTRLKIKEGFFHNYGDLNYVRYGI